MHANQSVASHVSGRAPPLVGAHRGLAYVEFETRAAAEKALDYLHEVRKPPEEIEKDRTQHAYVEKKSREPVRVPRSRRNWTATCSLSHSPFRHRRAVCSALRT